MIEGNYTQETASTLALQLRYLQTLTEVASEKNSTTIFPIPIDLIAPFMKAFTDKTTKKK